MQTTCKHGKKERICGNEGAPFALRNSQQGTDDTPSRLCLQRTSLESKGYTAHLQLYHWRSTFQVCSPACDYVALERRCRGVAAGTARTCCR